jgi:hypothetical protein
VIARVRARVRNARMWRGVESIDTRIGVKYHDPRAKLRGTREFRDWLTIIRTPGRTDIDPIAPSVTDSKPNVAWLLFQKHLAH